MKNVFPSNVNKYYARCRNICLLPRFGLCETAQRDNKKEDGPERRRERAHGAQAGDS
ncbi:hypothetical protein SBA2_510006 [Acidobacteriia bacterium SbA2]|nr:hypothetical protein SBA2_510006 [Acidobacteriia bacterium SbA2]